MTTWAEWLAENTVSPEETLKLKSNRLNEDLSDIQSFSGITKHDIDGMDKNRDVHKASIPANSIVTVHYHKPSNMTSVVHTDNFGELHVSTFDGHHSEFVK